jgi:hypothetical protein
VRELALVCLEVDKKVLAYTLFTKYIGDSSFSYIGYLIQNTPELAEYRPKSTAVVSLPVMSKRPEKERRPSKTSEGDPHGNMRVNPKPTKPVSKSAFHDQ